jgi:cell division septation protein DedD
MTLQMKDGNVGFWNHWTLRSIAAPRRAALFFLALLALSTATSLHAQTDQRLRDALRIAQEGSSDSARALVSAILQGTQPTDTLYPQVLYTMGLVSRSVEDMRRNYTRVAVEYNISDWADDATYRLGLLDYAAGNTAGAVRQMDKLRSDYPDSPLIGPAAEWAARALFDQKRTRDACGWLASGMEQAQNDVELRNRLDFMNARCTPQALADTSPSVPSQAPASQAAPAPASTPAPAPVTRTGFGVQVGAVNTQAAADKLSADLKAAGFAPYTVKEGALFKVRVGPYPDRAAAGKASEKIRTTMRHSPFVVPEK